MIWRIAVGGGIWLGALALFMGAVLRQPPARVPAATAPAAPLVRALNRPQADAGRWWSWKVTRATSAHRVMLVDVEAQQVADARAIAIQVVEPVRTHGYEEILVYVRRPGAAADAPERRVQWTPRGGYVEMALPGPPP